MRTIPKNSREAKRALRDAKNIRVYSLSNGFEGRPLLDSTWYKDFGSENAYLEMQLDGLKSKLTNEGNHYVLHIHANLWYEFVTHEHNWILQADDTRLCECGERRGL